MRRDPWRHSNFAASRKLAIHVADHVALRGHDLGTRHRVHVDEGRRASTASGTVMGRDTRGQPDTGFAAMQMRGKEAMRVDQYTSTHKFDALSDGGRIELRLIATFVGVVAAGILVVGYVFNAVL